MIAKSWFDRCWQRNIGGCVAIFGTLLVGGGERVNAQIVPDHTLGAESSIVTPDVTINGIVSDRIDGGAIRGANLFHSFEQLSVLEGRGAYFTNPAGILNILSRVTGVNRSEINGRLGVNGNANLFLINPNGIVFGPAASLDVQGSFLATTADAVKLGDAGLFSATQPATSNLLTVSPSALWFNAVAAQPIVNRSQAPSLIGEPSSDNGPPGLQVRSGRTLALVGGDVLLEGGRLNAAQGRIELGSVARVGQVSLSQSGNRFVLGYDSINDFGNISLSNRAFVDASGEGGGDIQIRGARLEMTQSSKIWANTLGAENGGKVLVRTTEVVLSESSLLNANVTITGTGTGGDLTIDTGRLLVNDRSQVSAGTRGEGNGGRLQITASDSVEVIGTGISADGEVPSGLLAASTGSGDAGNLTIDTGRLLVRDGAQVSANSLREGLAGNIKITVRDTLKANDGTITTVAQQSSGGDITITADTIRLYGDSDITTFVAQGGTGGGGNIILTAGSIIAFDDSDILAYAPDGKGGDLNLNTPVSFGENYGPASSREDPPKTLDANNRVDVAASGIITTPDVSFIQNNLTELPDNQIDTDSLLANSCIVRRNQPTRGSFTVTGTGGLPQRPGDAQMSTFPTVDIESLPNDSTPTNTNPNRPWQKGDSIVEPQGVYRLPNGKLVLSRECP
ncbi:filamentous hemagglutinin N-terminal domain-containing protein [Microcoleus sp. MON1_C5]|uniref:two-partner secretion domain-containing protein n=1 Tax=Microcoleus sp. MON1_C5 TaxID=2818828 RepID=UPI002FD4AF41